jgi:demethylmenaquinone methyltransferase/2-methoxy-6-polyprenyl-1,4-benzoquinol methylase
MQEYKYLAPVYDVVTILFLRRIHKKVLLLINELNSETVVDFCCGTGSLLKYLNKHKNIKSFGIDLSDHMLFKATYGKSRPICIKQDARQTTFSSDFFDVAIVSLALHEMSLSDAEKTVLEMKRVIKPDGKLFIIDYCFDEKISFLGKFIVTFVERIVGGQHYKNFRNYIKNGDYKLFFNDLKPLTEYSFFGKSVRLHVY